MVVRLGRTSQRPVKQHCHPAPGPVVDHSALPCLLLWLHLLPVAQGSNSLNSSPLKRFAAHPPYVPAHTTEVLAVTGAWLPGSCLPSVLFLNLSSSTLPALCSFILSPILLPTSSTASLLPENVVLGKPEDCLSPHLQGQEPCLAPGLGWVSGLKGALSTVAQLSKGTFFPLLPYRRLLCGT